MKALSKHPIYQWGIIFFSILLLSTIAYAIASGNLFIGVFFLVLPIFLFFVVKSYESPVIPLFCILIYGFIQTAVSVYLKIDGGLLVDFLLVFSYIILFFKGFRNHIDWKKTQNYLFYIVSIWMGLTVLELFNPEAPSKMAWLYAMRGVALYIWLFVPLGLILLDDVKYLKWFIYIWGVFSILATLYGWVQLHIGLNPVEKAMMAAGKAKTHMLFGKLRVFSFYSDAGQFGAAQAHSGITALLIFFGARDRRMRLFFLVVSLFSFYGMFISGTRGAMFVPFVGGLIYLLINKNIKVLIIGAILSGGFFYIMRYTYIGHNNYAIRRMRTAFDVNDPSFQVRLNNQQAFKAYLKRRPFGGGVGVTGRFGMRFSPHAYLSNIPTDSGFVRIWAEYGIAGLSFYIFMWVSIVIVGIRNIWYRLKDPWIKNVLSALICGLAGMLAANYGNPVIIQNPSALIVNFIIVFIFIAPDLEKKLTNGK